MVLGLDPSILIWYKLHSTFLIKSNIKKIGGQLTNILGSAPSAPLKDRPYLSKESKFGHVPQS